MKTPSSFYLKFLQNSLWYLIILVGLAGLTFFLPVLWWLPWLVSVGWGISLLAHQVFGGNEAEVDNRGQLQVYLDRALTYRAQINSTIKASVEKSDRARLGQLSIQINSWVEAIQKLVERIASLQQNPLILQDRVEVPKAIENLKSRLVSETDLATRVQLEQALINYGKQIAALEELQITIERAEIQVESTLSLLGTIYSQILTSQSTHHVADYSKLSADVDEQVHLLQDHLEALREVKLGERVERSSR